MTILKEFLVGITYKVNNQSSFIQSLTVATNGFNTLSKVAANAAQVVANAVATMSDNLDKLYFVSMRTKASAENITAISYAAKQAGTSAESMVASIENVASRLRRLPGIGQLLGNFGIDGRGDPTKIITQLQRRLSDKPEWLQLQYADLFGIDEKTWLGIKNMSAAMEDQKAVSRALGLDMDKAAKSANTLWTQIRRVGMVIDVIVAKAVEELGNRYSKAFAQFSDLLVRNGERISKVIVFLVDLFLKFVEALGAVAKAFYTSGEAIIGWFTRLDPAIQKVAMGIGGLLVAWRLLNAGFLATPLGRIVAAMTALALLLDDYLTFKQVGQGENGSLFDWSGVDSIASLVGDAMKKAGELARAGWQWLIDIVEWFKTSSVGRYFTREQDSVDAARQQQRVQEEQRQEGRGTGFRGMFRRFFGFGPTGGQSGGGGGGDGPQSMNDTQRSMATQVDSLLSDLGFNPAQRAALLATAQRESGFRSDASVIDRNGQRSYGLFQHNGPRLAAMLRWAGKTRAEDLTWQDQVMFMAHEMQNDPAESRRAGRFMGATSPRTAGGAITSDVIRPYDPSGAVDRRMQDSAERWMDFIQRPTVPATAASPGAGGTGDQAAVSFSPTAYINVTTSDPTAAARQVIAGQDELHQRTIRNFRPRVV